MTINIQNPEYAIVTDTDTIEPNNNPLNLYFITLQTVDYYQRRRFPFNNNINITSNRYIRCNIESPNKQNESQLINLLNLEADTLYRIFIGADQFDYPADKNGYPDNDTITNFNYSTEGPIGPCNIVVSEQLITSVRSNARNQVTYTFNSFSYYPAFNTNQFVKVTGIISNYGSDKFNKP